MFTLLHERDDGSQQFHKVLRVQYYPMTELNGRSGGVHMLKGPDEAEDASCGQITDGRVFLMNEQGATVGRFYLHVPAAPPSDPPSPRQ